MSTTSQSTIADQVSDFNIGFNETVGPELAAVFAGEQADLVAHGIPAATVQTGETIPDVELVSADESLIALSDVLAGSPAVLVFYRGAWCPYCNLTLKHYNEKLAPELSRRGVALIAISPQTPDGSRAAVTNGELAFKVLSDPGNALAGALGLVTAPSAAAQQAHTALGFAVKDSNADGTPAIPYPTVIVSDAARAVRFVDVHVDYTTRTEVADILAAVDAL